MASDARRSQGTDPADPRAAGAGPRDPTEALLCAVWGELLGVERIGIDDDVFELGAHSLHVMWAAARILDRTGLEPPTRWFYEEPTVAGLARLLAGMAGGSAGKAAGKAAGEAAGEALARGGEGSRGASRN